MKEIPVSRKSLTWTLELMAVLMGWVCSLPWLSRE